MSDQTYSESYIERMDARRLEHEHEMHLKQLDIKAEVAAAKAKATEARWDNARIVLLCVLAGVLVLGLFWSIYYWTSGPEEPDTTQQMMEDCFDRGGGWVPAELIEGITEGGLCVMPGRKAKDPNTPDA